jgi:hypothetical protein
MAVTVSLSDFVFVTDIAVTDKGMSLPCHLLVRYLDPRWKRYGYPFIAGDLRIRLDDAFCERSALHKDDVPAFVARLRRYVPTIEADATVSVLPGSAVPAVPYVRSTSEAFSMPQNSAHGVATYSAPRHEYTPAPVAQYAAPIPGRQVQKSKGCGCRKS